MIFFNQRVVATGFFGIDVGFLKHNVGRGVYVDRAARFVIHVFILWKFFVLGVSKYDWCRDVSAAC